jgi:hypothetical protein
MNMTVSERVHAREHTSSSSNIHGATDTNIPLVPDLVKDVQLLDRVHGLAALVAFLGGTKHDVGCGMWDVGCGITWVGEL